TNSESRLPKRTNPESQIPNPVRYKRQIPNPVRYQSRIPNPDLYNLPVEHRAAAFARLFEAVHEGVYIGTLGPERTTTIAANPHLKLIFGYASEAPENDVRPFDRERFVDPHARAALLD